MAKAEDEVRALSWGEREAYLLHKQPFASILQALSTFLDPSPTLQHIRNFTFQQCYPLQNTVAHLDMVGDRLQVSVKVRFLTSGNRLVDQREPVVELLRGLDGLLWV